MHPSTAADLGGCVETDDLSAAGITREQLEGLLSGSGPRRMRHWLEGLGPVERSVFVLRAVLGRSGAESAQLLQHATQDSLDRGPCGRRISRGAVLAGGLAGPLLGTFAIRRSAFRVNPSCCGLPFSLAGSVAAGKPKGKF